MQTDTVRAEQGGGPIILARMESPLPTSTTPAHLFWRLLAMLYDSLPILALWLALSTLILLCRGGVPIAPWSLAFWLQSLGLLALTGAYLVFSWRRGGQTLGMRAWRLRIIDDSGDTASVATLWKRYGWATLSLAAGGLGFLWSLLDHERQTLHDRLSATRMVRLPKPGKH